MPKQARPRVLLADDHVEVLTALQRLLEPSCDIIGRATDGTALLEAAQALEPDVIVLDMFLPAVDGLEACRRIRQARPETKVVLLTAADGPAFRERAFEVGASAFISKLSQVDQLVPAILRAFAGETDGIPES